MTAEKVVVDADLYRALWTVAYRHAPYVEWLALSPKVLGDAVPVEPFDSGFLRGTPDGGDLEPVPAWIEVTR